MDVFAFFEEQDNFKGALLGIDRGPIVKDLITSKEKIPKKWDFLACGLKSQDVLIRSFQIPLKNKRALFQTLPFQIESRLPYPPEQALVIPTFIKGQKETEVLLFACLKEKLQAHIKQYEEEDPDWISTEIVGLWRFARFSCPEKMDFVHIHIGLEKSLVLLYEQGFLKKSTQINSGYTDFLKEKKTDLSLWISAFRQKIDRAFFYLFSDSKFAMPLFFTGIDLGIKWQTFFEKDIEIFKPSNVQFKKFPSMGLWAVPIGIALDVLAKDDQSVQFRVGPYRSKRLSKRIKKKFLFLGLLFSLIIFMFGFFSYTWKLRKREEILKQFKNITASLPLEIPNGNISHKNLFTEIDKIEKALNREKQLYYIYKQPVSVSHLLVFLSKSAQGINFQSLHYRFEEYPDLQRPYAKFKIKVNLHFETPSSENAYQFKQQLMENAWIESKDFSWERLENGYEVSFFLKNP